MSLKPSPIEPVPEETARVARAAFRKGNPLLKLRDELDADFADLFPERGRQRTDATHVLASIRVLNRLELVGETLRDFASSIGLISVPTRA